MNMSHCHTDSLPLECVADAIALLPPCVLQSEGEFRDKLSPIYVTLNFSLDPLAPLDLHGLRPILKYQTTHLIEQKVCINYAIQLGNILEFLFIDWIELEFTPTLPDISPYRAESVYFQNIIIFTRPHILHFRAGMYMTLLLKRQSTQRIEGMNIGALWTM